MTISLDYQIVPLSDAPSQSVSIALGQQSCRIVIYTKSTNVPTNEAISTDPPSYENTNPVFMDLYVNDALVVGGVICLSGVRLVRDAYLGLVGDLAIIDTGVPQQTSPAQPAQVVEVDVLLTESDDDVLTEDNGDLLATVDTSTTVTTPPRTLASDPQGVSRRLPPPDLRNLWQRSLPLRLGGIAPPDLANHIPGLGTRYLLTYWPNLGAFELPNLFDGTLALPS